jgi:hypothetical protein
VTKQKHLKRRIRERMQKTGESYTTARLHLLGTPPDVPREAARPDRRGPKRIQLRVRQLSLRTPRPLGLRYVAPAFGMVLLLALGAAGFLVVTVPQPLSVANAPTTTGR